MSGQRGWDFLVTVGEPAALTFVITAYAAQQITAHERAIEKAFRRLDQLGSAATLHGSVSVKHNPEVDL